jgi:catalase (peroxidase I)
LTFDNSYFQRVVGDHSSPSTTSSGVFSTTTDQLDASQLMWLPTDQALYDCPEYRPYFLRYAADQGEFFRDFSAAYLKMSELGAKFQGVVRLTAAEQGK